MCPKRVEENYRNIVSGASPSLRTWIPAVLRCKRWIVRIIPGRKQKYGDGTRLSNTKRELRLVKCSNSFPRVTLKNMCFFFEILSRTGHSGDGIQCSRSPVQDLFIE